jgi:hypothetical protein
MKHYRFCPLINTYEKRKKCIQDRKKKEIFFCFLNYNFKKQNDLQKLDLVFFFLNLIMLLILMQEDWLDRIKLIKHRAW